MVSGKTEFVLILISMAGCPACAAFKPEWEKLVPMVGNIVETRHLRVPNIPMGLRYLAHRVPSVIVAPLKDLELNENVENAVMAESFGHVIVEKNNGRQFEASPGRNDGTRNAANVYRWITGYAIPALKTRLREQESDTGSHSKLTVSPRQHQQQYLFGHRENSAAACVPYYRRYCPLASSAAK